MNKSRLKEQVEIIRQAFGYIDQFKNEIFVIKIDDVLISNPFFPVFIKDLVLLHKMGIRIILVPGARTRIDDILKTYKIECQSANGIRISPPEAIPLIKMAAFDVSNKIMTMLAENGAQAVIGNWVRARGIGVREGIDFQSSGIVERLQIDVIKNVLDDNLIPIFPNIGWSLNGKPYNLSSNDLAFTISIQLNAAKLFFVTDKGGISADGFNIPEGVYVSSDNVISQLTLKQATAFLELNSGSEDKEKLELIRLAHRACESGVKRVHIINGHAEGMILKEIFSSRGFGTMIYANQHDHIRQMTIADIPGVLSLMQPAIEEKILVKRSVSDLQDKVDDYVVYDVDGTIHACGALHTFPDRQGEIAGIVVDEMYTNLGIGKKIVEYLIEKAIKARLKSVFILTTQTSDWFSQLGFQKASVADLPAEKRTHYNSSRNSLVLRYKLSRYKTRRVFEVE
ncbi:MAG: amino-acid N-acetyltransferase [Fibrobacter sp.]|jgi:amino-acid N-acetyltransferase|nr:amino-acid N-acetyltransferase [Fibrobacter sp.]